MKKLLLSAAIAASLGMIPTVQAATTTNNFNVSVTLSSQCQVTNDATQTVNFGTYTAFQAAPQASVSSAGLTFRCTRGFAPVSTAFDAGGNSTAAGVGVLVGLQYALTAAAGVTTPGTAATSAIIGTGDSVLYTVSGSMPADQAGTCGAATCGPTTQVRQLIVTF